eukprot:m.126839 g.126839  ORF g.126839 m.126839 type:complete len:137 (+) comp13844_c0_seq7:231-641(+)
MSFILHYSTETHPTPFGHCLIRALSPSVTYSARTMSWFQKLRRNSYKHMDGDANAPSERRPSTASSQGSDLSFTASADTTLTSIASPNTSMLGEPTGIQSPAPSSSSSTSHRSGLSHKGEQAILRLTFDSRRYGTF